MYLNFVSYCRFIYTDSATIKSCDEACKLYYAAKKYMLPHLNRKCIAYLISNLSPVNVCSAYEFAKMFDVPTLVQECVEVCVKLLSLYLIILRYINIVFFFKLLSYYLLHFLTDLHH